MAKDDMIYGIRPVSEALRAQKEIERLFIAKGRLNENQSALLQEAAALKVPILRVPAAKLNRLTKKNHQGVIAFLSVIRYASLDHLLHQAFSDGRMPFLLLLDRITDVRNFGAICRAADCAGIDAVLIPDKGAAQINADAMRASAGALQHLSVCRVKNLVQTLKFLQESGLSAIACTEKAEKTLYQTDLSSPLVIIMGSEENGISPPLLARANALAKIPMGGKIASLNVSVACGIVLFEARRQHGLPLT